MPLSQSGVPYFVRNVDGKTNRREHLTDGAYQTSEILQVDWRNYRPFRSDLLGRCNWIGGGIHRELPMFHPVYNWMICTEAELIEVIGTPTDQGGICDFEDGAIAVVAATFKSVLYGVLTDEQSLAYDVPELSRYVQRQSRFGLELLELRGTQLEYSDIAGGALGAKAVIQANPTRAYPNMPLVYTWLRVPSVPPAAGGRPDGFPATLFANIEATVGKINSDTFDNFYDPGTLLCGMPEIEQRVGPLGDIEFAVKYTFTWHSPKDNITPGGAPAQTDSWNVKYRAFDALGVTRPGMYPVDIKGSGGDVPFRSAPFAALFRNS